MTSAGVVIPVGFASMHMCCSCVSRISLLGPPGEAMDKEHMEAVWNALVPEAAELVRIPG